MRRIVLFIVLAGCLSAPPPDAGPEPGTEPGEEIGLGDAGSDGAPSPGAREVPSVPGLLCDPCDVRVDAGGSAFEPSIAGHDEMVALGYSTKRVEDGLHTKWNHLVLSRDRGVNWERIPLGGAFDGYNELGDPLVGFLPDGSIVYVTIALTKLQPNDEDAAFTGFDLFAGIYNGTWDWTVVAPGIGAASTEGDPVAYEANDRPFLDISPVGHITVGWTRISRNMPSSEDGSYAMTIRDVGDGFGRPRDHGRTGGGASVVTHNGTTWLAMRTLEGQLRVKDLAGPAEVIGDAQLDGYPPYLSSTAEGLFVSARLEDGTPAMFRMGDDLVLMWQDPVDVDTSPVNAPTYASRPASLYYTDGAAVLRTACGPVTLADGIESDPQELGHYFGIGAGLWVAWLEDDTSVVHVARYIGC